jgi:hypothetical protein
MEKTSPKVRAKPEKARGWRRFRNLLLTVAIQGLVLLILLEVAARFFDPAGVSYFPETARFFDTMVHEEPISYRLQPGLDGNFNHAHYQVNSLGFRGPEIPIEKPPGEFRIMWLGDSLVFGIGVNNDQTMAADLEKIANSRSAGVHYRVLNMGVPSYNTEQELIQFETLGLRLQPDAVMLLFAANDIEKKNWVFDKRRSWIADFAQRSYALSTLFVFSRFARETAGVPEAFINMPDYAEDNPRWRAIADSLSRIHEVCKEKSIPFVVLTMGSLDDMPNRMVAAEGRKDGFDVIGLQPQLDPRWPDAGSLRYHNSKVDSHPNVEGSEMWATLLYDHLVRLNIINPAARPQ